MAQSVLSVPRNRHLLNRMGETRQIGILFADISGSTRLYEALGDQRAHAIVRQTMAISSRPVEEAGGVVVKTIGDELMAAFPSAKGAFDAALAIQRRLKQMPPLPSARGEMRVQIRIGLHFGQAVEEDGDFFGDSVNVAARLVGLAKATQIVTTAEVLEMLGPDDRARGNSFGDIDVKGRATPVRAAQVEWDARPQSVTVFRLAGDDAAAEPSLRLVFEGRNWRVPHDRKTIACGRDPESDLVLKGPQVSRAHATIEHRRGKYVLVDHSTNGTWLMLDARPPVRLHREEFGLVKQGCVVFGVIDSEESDTLWFYVE
jgi:adenylate cyclase